MAQQQAPAPGQQQAPTAVPAVVKAEKVELVATVEAVDPQSRTVTLKGPGGDTVVVRAGPAVKNLDQIKVGDPVKAQYLQATAISVKKPGEAASGAADPGGAKTVVLQAPGDTGGTVMNIVEETATVQDIDRNARKVTLALPQGKEIDINVDPSVGLEQVNKGDQVVIQHTEAVALELLK